MKIEILGTGCAKCKQLYQNAEQALKESGVQAEIIKIQEIDKITDYGVMMTPALAVDGTVVSAGKVLSKDEIERNLNDALGSGKLEFKAVNTDEKGNEHFLNDYQLYTKSLVLSLVENGREVKSKNLARIW